jgi:hypothetical protein
LRNVVVGLSAKEAAALSSQPIARKETSRLGRKSRSGLFHAPWRLIGRPRQIKIENRQSHAARQLTKPASGQRGLFHFGGRDMNREICGKPATKANCVTAIISDRRLN